MLGPGRIGCLALGALLSAGCRPAGDAAAEPSVGPAPAGQGPYLAMSDTGPVLRLPPGMHDALAAYAPRFRPWRLDEYYADVAARAGPPERLPLFGVAGDFNGDGVVDVALQGHDAASEYFVAIVSEGASFRVVELLKRPYVPDPGGPGRAAYLRPVPPGRVDVPPAVEALEGPAPVLTTDAFEEVFEGQVGVLYYWKDGRFVEYVLGE